MKSSFFIWLIKPWGLTLLAIGVLALMLWFDAMLGIDGYSLRAQYRMQLICSGLFLLWLASWVGVQLHRYWFNQQLSHSLDQAITQAGSNQTAAQVALLNQQMQHAIQVLRKATSQGGKGYAMPWYLVMGRPRCGKSTLLTQSGQKFLQPEVLAAPTHTGDLAPACDWWFTDKAVLVDTSGHYLSKDASSEAHQVSWNTLLQLLCQRRRRRPINGIVVAISATELLTQSPDERQAHAQLIHDRINELHQHLGIRFPIYVTLTQCDVLAGFTEFFEHLSQQERAQVWGVTFSLKDSEHPAQALQTFAQQCKQLETQLQVRLLARLGQERDVQRRALIYGLAQQLVQLATVLQDFLKDAFLVTLFEVQPMLRGVYFTSAAQEGITLHHGASSLAQRFGLTPPVPTARVAAKRSYFIAHLFDRVIFEEAGLAGSNLGIERKRRWLERSAVALTTIVGAALLAGMLTSNWLNHEYIDSVAGWVKNVGKQTQTAYAQDDLFAVLPLLDAARNIPGGYADQNKTPSLLMTFGLYQGDRLGADAQELYYALLDQTLLPRIATRLEAQLRRGSANSDEYLYETLRVYLMLNEPDLFDEKKVRAWVEQDLKFDLTQADSVQKEALLQHVSALFDKQRFTQEANADAHLLGGNYVQAGLLLDDKLIEQTRRTLAKIAPAQWIYAHLKRDLQTAHLPEFTVSNAGGRYAFQVFVRRSGEPLTRGVPGLYTRQGFKAFSDRISQAVLEAAENSWVLGSKDAITDAAHYEQLKTSLRQTYFAEYIRQWDLFLADLSIVSFTDLSNGAWVMRVLAGPESPLRSLLTAAASETTLDRSPTGPVPPSLIDKVKNQWVTYKKKISGALSTATGTPAIPTPLAQEYLPNPVDSHFETLHVLTKASPGKPSALDQILTQFKDVAAYFDGVEAAKRANAPLPASTPLTQLQQAMSGAPPVLLAALSSIQDKGATLSMDSETARLNAIWMSEVAPFCKAAIAERYPIVRSATAEITPDDFGKFFAPGGLMDNYFQKYLLPYVDMSASDWRWRSVGTTTLDVGPDVLPQFQNAAKIRATFFVAGGKQPSMLFELKVLSADPRLEAFKLDIDGQTLSYKKDSPPAAAMFQLPSGKGPSYVNLQATPRLSEIPMKIDGPWAWLHAIDRGRLEITPQDERFKLTLNLQGRLLELELKANSVINPYNLAALQGFRCLEGF